MDADYPNMLRARAAGKCVTFLHDADDAGLVAEYRRATCVVLPSVYTTPDGRTTLVPELLGQTLLEAMACGRPAICTDVASMPEVVVHGETGYVVPPGNPPALGAAIAASSRTRRRADSDGRTRPGARARAFPLGERRGAVPGRVSCLIAWRRSREGLASRHAGVPAAAGRRQRALAGARAAAASRGRDVHVWTTPGALPAAGADVHTTLGAFGPADLARTDAALDGMPRRAICSCNGCRTGSATAA